MIHGINHITLSIRNVEESFSFYTQILECKPLCRWPKGAYLSAGGMWIALVLDQNSRKEKLPEYTHIAFTVERKDFALFSEKIKNSGAEIWQENWTEGDSLYFLDPNGHKLEIHASSLEERMDWAKKNPWEGLEFFV